MNFSQWLRLCLTIATVLFFAQTSYSQSFADNALLFSRTRPAGSARVQALGGAQTSLGGDYSSALSNPAGLGMYNRSEITVSLGQNFSNTNVDYLGTSSSDASSKFNIPGLSLVLHYGNNRDNESGFLGGSFAITLSRTNDLNQNYTYSGRNDNSSIVDYFIQDANYLAPDNPDDMLFDGPQFYNLTALAYNTYLIDPAVDPNNGDFLGYYGSLLSPLADIGEKREMDQRETIQRKGAQYQWSIAYGANFSDKLFVGASLGIATLRYKQSTTYEESNFQYSTGYDTIRSFNMREDLDIQGTGANFTVGLIYRPVDFLQVGASFVTPTVYQLTDNYTASMDVDWKYDPDASERFDQPLLSEYNLKTPLKFSAGATFISKYGFITADIEFVNYGNAKYSSNTSGVSYSGDNDEIKSSYGAVTNYRFGAEFRHDIFRARAGYNLSADPYLTDNDVDRKIQAISAGVGVRLKTFYTDLTFVTSKMDGKRIPYSAEGFPTPVAQQEFKTNNVMLTVGFTF